MEEKFVIVSNHNARIVELANIKQRRTVGIRDYMQRVVSQAESAFIEADIGNLVSSYKTNDMFFFY